MARRRASRSDDSGSSEPATPATPAAAPDQAAAPKLLSSGNPQIAKGEGEGPVQAYLAAMPGWKHDVGCRLHTLIVGTLPDVRMAVKWNTPLYGLDGRSWLLSLYCYTRYVQVAFLRGAALDPVPPKASKQAEVRYWEVHEHDEIDDERFVSWVRQAAALGGVVL